MVCQSETLVKKCNLDATLHGSTVEYGVDMNAGSTKRQGSSPADSVLIDNGSDRRRSARASQGVIPQAKIKTIKMTFVIVIGNCFYRTTLC